MRKSLGNRGRTNGRFVFSLIILVHLLARATLANAVRCCLASQGPRIWTPNHYKFLIVENFFKSDFRWGVSKMNFSPFITKYVHLIKITLKFEDTRKLYNWTNLWCSSIEIVRPGPPNRVGPTLLATAHPSGTRSLNNDKVFNWRNS